METGQQREFGVVDPDEEVPLPTVEPLTGIEPDAEAEAERTQTWGEKKPEDRSTGAPAGGA